MRAPHVQASMPVQHPWLDATGNVQSHPDLNQWTAHSDLGRIGAFGVGSRGSLRGDMERSDTNLCKNSVSEIVAELRRQAASLQASVQNPKQTSQNQQQQQSASASAAAASSQLYPPSYPQYITPATPPTPPTPPKKDPPQLQRSQMPVIPAIFPALEELSYAAALIPFRHDGLYSADLFAIFLASRSWRTCRMIATHSGRLSTSSTASRNSCGSAPKS
jgi:hypothetical protein